MPARPDETASVQPATRKTPSAARRLSGLNEAVALKMTLCFGSIWCVYAFTVFSLVPMLFPKSQNMLLYVSNCIQLVALPAIMVGSALLARSSEQRALEDHVALLEVLASVRLEIATIRALHPETLPEFDRVKA